MQTIFIKMENSETNEPPKSLEVSDLRSSNKQVAFQDLSVYYSWKNIRQKQQTQNNSPNAE